MCHCAEILASLWQSWVASIPAFESAIVTGGGSGQGSETGAAAPTLEIDDATGRPKLEAVAIQVLLSTKKCSMVLYGTGACTGLGTLSAMALEPVSFL